MKKFAFTAFIILLSLPVFAGQYEDALRTGNPVCLYMHTKTCRYCKQVNPIFEKAMKNYHKDYNFVSIDAESPYGFLLMNDLRAGYVPFIMLADAKRQYVSPIFPTCAAEYSCFEKELKNFLKK